MTSPAVIRIFFAIDLPASAKKKVGHFINMLKKQSKSHAIRWTKPENLHITLQFLPEVKVEHIAMLKERVRAKMTANQQKIKWGLGSLHLFPNPYRPRVIVLDITPQDQLAELSGLIGEGIVDGHYEIENRPFRAHLTLGRIKQPQGLSLNFLSELKAPSLEEMEMEEIMLFRSEPQPDGSKYTVLDKVKV
ncbi:MAG: RNA 2',3'-cyclic phosphodiesterase [Gammaproteobacteria bacterium]|nr:MAG: RNA 2',3'-cyclic phosphodiesterase [Gammaproteobacteria bacterium]